MHETAAGQAWALFETFAVGAHGYDYDVAMGRDEPTQIDHLLPPYGETTDSLSFTVGEKLDAVKMLSPLVFSTPSRQSLTTKHGLFWPAKARPVTMITARALLILPVTVMSPVAHGGPAPVLQFVETA